MRRLFTLGNILNRRLAEPLHKWVGDGSYGSLFDNPEDNLTLARFQCFDFEGMDKYPQVLEPLLFYILHRANSFVKIDSRQRKVIGNWQNDFDRPIYFVELRGSYVCCWCELHGDQLILIPTPHTRARARHVRYPTDADIVGRVTAVTMSIAEVRETL